MAIDCALFGNGRVLYAPTTHIVYDDSLCLIVYVGRVKNGCAED